MTCPVSANEDHELRDGQGVTIEAVRRIRAVADNAGMSRLFNSPTGDPHRACRKPRRRRRSFSRGGGGGGSPSQRSEDYGRQRRWKGAEEGARQLTNDGDDEDGGVDDEHNDAGLGSFVTTRFVLTYHCLRWLMSRRWITSYRSRVRRESSGGRGEYSASWFDAMPYVDDTLSYFGRGCLRPKIDATTQCGSVRRCLGGGGGGPDSPTSLLLPKCRH